MSVALFASGTKLRASRLNDMIRYMTNPTASKAADLPRFSTTSRTADPDLVVAMAANTTYDMEALLLGASEVNAGGDFSGEWQYPSDAILTFAGFGLVDTLASGTSADLQAGAVSQDGTSPAGPFVLGLSTSTTGMLVTATITTVTAGNLTLAWAQNSSNVNDSILKAGSRVTLTPVG